MRPLIRTSLFLFIFCLFSIPVLAGSGIRQPKWVFTLSLRSVQQLDSLLTVSPTILASEKSSNSSEANAFSGRGRICSCQVLNLKSSNYNYRLVVLLAEKTNGGSNTDFRVARNRIQIEKKQLKKMFYDKVKVVSEMQSTGSCRSLFFRLRMLDRRLQLYEMLNAD